MTCLDNRQRERAEQLKQKCGCYGRRRDECHPFVDSHRSTHAVLRWSSERGERGNKKREADQNGSLSAGATKYVWFFIITTSVNCKGIERNRMTTLNLLYSYLELGPYIHE